MSIFQHPATPDIITLRERQFRLFLTPAQINEAILRLGREISDAYEEPPVLVVVLNGAFIFAADLVRTLHFPVQLHFTQLSSYHDEMTSSGTIRQTLPLSQTRLQGRHVLVVEDIVDSGLTLDWLHEHLKTAHRARSIRTACLLFKPTHFKGLFAPDFIGFEVPPRFVVGYGMDYANEGRELPGVYALAE